MTLPTLDFTAANGIPFRAVLVMLDGRIEEDDLPHPEAFVHKWQHSRSRLAGTPIRTCSTCGSQETYWDDEAYPFDPCIPEPVVEFYDRRFPFTQHGQFVSRHYFSDLYQLPAVGLNLDTGVDAWSVDDRSMDALINWAHDTINAANLWWQVVDALSATYTLPT